MAQMFCFFSFSGRAHLAVSGASSLASNRTTDRRCTQKKAAVMSAANMLIISLYLSAANRLLRVFVRGGYRIRADQFHHQQPLPYRQTLSYHIPKYNTSLCYLVFLMTDMRGVDAADALHSSFLFAIFFVSFQLRVFSLLFVILCFWLFFLY